MSSMRSTHRWPSRRSAVLAALLSLAVLTVTAPGSGAQTTDAAQPPATAGAEGTALPAPVPAASADAETGAAAEPATPPPVAPESAGQAAADGAGAQTAPDPAIPDPAAEALEPQPSAGVAAAHLPRDLSPWNMFLSADIVVKAVMIGLAFASVVTWTVWLAKTIELAWAKRALARAARALSAAPSLAEARDAVSGKRGVVHGLMAVAATELALSQGLADKAGIKERVASRLDGLTLAAGRTMNHGTGALATIGSTAPFVGLFGTVWGIMNSFIGISEAQTTNLAVVAPGIAEALLATAIGLVAAIPAVIIYNQFARAISAYRASVVEASAEVLRLVSRDLDRGASAPLARAAE